MLQQFTTAKRLLTAVAQRCCVLALGACAQARRCRARADGARPLLGAEGRHPLGHLRQVPQGPVALAGDLADEPRRDQESALIYPGDVIVLDVVDGPAALTLDARTPCGCRRPIARERRSTSQAIPSIPPGDIEPYLTRPLVTGPDGLANAAEIVAGRDAARGPRRGRRRLRRRHRPEGRRLWYIYRPGRTLVDARRRSETSWATSSASSARAGRALRRPLDGAHRVGPRGNPRRRPPAFPRRADARQLRPARAGQADRAATSSRSPATRPKPGAAGSSRSTRARRTASTSAPCSPSTASFRRSPIRGRRSSRTGSILAAAPSSARSSPPDRYLDIPDERTGLMFVFRIFDRVSYAIVLNTTDPVAVGDYARTP